LPRSTKRLLVLLLSLPLLLVLFAALYGLGMAHLEGEERDFWSSLEWAAETLTTTGYGADARWRHPAMVVYVAGVQLVGVFLAFLVFPIYRIPFLEERWSVRRAGQVAGHIVAGRLLGEETVSIGPSAPAARWWRSSGAPRC
jgi:hypothetical protein